MIEQTINLIGCMAKKATGQLENGSKWETDRVDLHVLMPLDTKKGGLGFGGQLIKLDDHDKWLPIVTPLVGHEIILISEMITDGKGGGQSVKCVGVRAIPSIRKSA
jgi:hypothetical protein